MSKKEKPELLGEKLMRLEHACRYIGAFKNFSTNKTLANRTRIRNREIMQVESVAKKLDHILHNYKLTELQYRRLAVAEAVLKSLPKYIKTDQEIDRVWTQRYRSTVKQNSGETK